MKQQSVELYPETKEDESQVVQQYPHAYHVVQYNQSHQDAFHDPVFYPPLNHQPELDFFNQEEELAQHPVIWPAVTQPMKKKKLKKCLIITLLVCLCLIGAPIITGVTIGASCALAHRSVRIFSEDIAGMYGTLSISGPGPVEIIPVQGSTLTLKVESRYLSERSYATSFSRQGNSIIIQTIGSRRFCTREKRVIYIPVALAANLNLVVNIDGDVRQSQDHGGYHHDPDILPVEQPLSFRSIQMKVTNGDVILDDILSTSACSIQGLSTTIHADTVACQSVNLDVKSGEIVIDVLKSENGATLKSVSGEICVRNSLHSNTTVTITNISGSIKVSGMNAPSALLTTDSGEIQLQSKAQPGSFQLDSKSGEVHVSSSSPVPISWLIHSERKAYGYFTSQSTGARLIAFTKSGEVSASFF